MNNLRNVLKMLREKENKKQVEIAKDLNITQKAYSNYETGKREPCIDMLIKMANHYNTSIDILVGRYESTTNNKDTTKNENTEFKKKI